MQNRNSNMLLEKAPHCHRALVVHFGQCAKRDGESRAHSGNSHFKVIIVAVVNQLLCSRTNRSAGVNCNSQQCSIFHVDSRPSRCVNCALCERRDSKRDSISILLSLLFRSTQSVQEGRFKCRIATGWVNSIQILEKSHRLHDWTQVRKEEKSVSPLPDKPTLDGWRKDCREYGSHCAQGGPSIPVDYASLTQHPALAHAIQHAHSLIPLWAGQHSATPLQRAENAHV